MSNTSKADLCAEIRKLCAEKGVSVPEGLDELKQLPLFDELEKLTGVKDPRRPGAGGAVRASTPPAAAPKAEEPKAEEPKAEEPKAEEPKADEPKADEPKADEPKADEPEAKRPARFSASGRYLVAEGRCVSCLPGMIGAFQEIRALDLGDGEEGLDRLWAEGAIVAAKR
jgi:hypothetical protein